MSFRGRADDDSIMVIEQKTLRLRELCTSNTFWLVNRDTGIIEETTQSIIEAGFIKGSTGRLVSLLKEHPYEGPGPTTDLLRVDSLNGYIQASDDEIEATLKKYNAVVIDGHWRVLGPSYLCRFFELFFTSALLEDWQVVNGTVSRRSVIEKFKEEFYDEFGSELILQTIFNAFQDDAHGANDEWKVSEVKVCRFFADQLLRAKQYWESPEFMKAWRKLVGEFTPSLPMLRGLALFEQSASSSSLEDLRLRHFSLEDLPTSPADRFRVLFQTRMRWYYEDLEPYVEDLAGDEKALKGVVIKFVRFSTEASTERQVVTPLIPP